MDKTGIEEELIKNINLVMTKIIESMNNLNKRDVRKYTRIFNDLIDSFCLDGVIAHYNGGCRK